MMRAYHCFSVATAKSLVSLQSHLSAGKNALGRVLNRNTFVDGRVARALCVLLVVSLLAAASPSARQTIAALASESRGRMLAWASPNNPATKVFRSLANPYGSYETWSSARAARKPRKNGESATQPAASAGIDSISVLPSMVPLPPDPPPAFTDDPLVAGVTVVKALHITELRDAVNQVRARAGLGAATWGESVTGGVPIKADHILELRTRLNEARTAMGLAAASYSDPPPSIGSNIRAAHVQELRDRVTETFTATSNTDSAVARLDPANQTGGDGENPLSRNFNWSIPLVGLPGRNGLDLGISLSYNSLVWTKRVSSISFNDDGGFPTPGFRLGFPVIQPLYHNSETGKNAFLLLSPDGSRTELRQVGTSALYEAADSSHLLLDTTSATMVLRTTDGTQLSYEWKGADYQCTQIKDRNGNFITINYTSFGRIDTVVDTLGRTIKFNYDGSNYLSSITQTWTVNGQSNQHNWATFIYANQTIQTNFSSLTNLGPQNGSTVKVLSQVTLDDGARYNFDYTSWGQVWKVSNFAPDNANHLLNYRSYNLPLDNTTALDDCPRFTQRHDWAENWNRTGPVGQALLPAGAEQEVTTFYSVPSNTSWTMPDGSTQTGKLAQVTQPDLTYNKVYFNGTAGTSSGWQRGLPTLVETYDAGNTRQRQSVTSWTQDDTNVSYPLNPRVTETNIYDPAGNRARTSVSYQTVTVGDGTNCKLPQDVYEYQANATTVLRRTHSVYNLDSAYLNRRIIGLASEKTLYQVDPSTLVETLMSKVGFQYDETGSVQGTDAPIQHDNTNYSAAFLTGRANLSTVTRYDVTNTSLSTASHLQYNTAGAVVAAIDPLAHTVHVSYADSFSDGGNSRNTLAYPTTVTDAENFASTSQYNFDFGAVTRKQTPLPNVTTNQPGPQQTVEYDSFGRPSRVTSLSNNAYTRFVYGPNYVETFASVNNVADEAHSVQVFDGAGRSIATASIHPGSAGGFSGQLTLFDRMGRAIKSSNPTETAVSISGVIQPHNWSPAGDDATAGWLYTQQTYDWKGRRLVTTNTDDTTKEASYTGCGCAGGQVVTFGDEAGRRQKTYSDVLGRDWKKESLNWDGSTYSTTSETLNARDQVTLIHEQASSSTYQDTVITYDGYGRLKTKHIPEQAAGLVTTWDYNPDDTILRSTDARGATSTFGYNNRKLVTSIIYAAPAGISGTPAVSYAYDAAGNRTSMADGLGNVSYNYNSLSQMISETRTFSDPNNTAINGVTRTLSYDHNLAGQLKKITDPTNSTINYTYDQTGRLNLIGGADNLYAGVTQYASAFQYRAWGALKHVTYGNGVNLNFEHNGRLQVSRFEAVNSAGQMLVGKEYQYTSNMPNNLTNDGHVKYSKDLVMNQLDRTYRYDQVGRLFEGVTGAEARQMKDSGVDDWSHINGPYWQVYGYDEGNHMSYRVWRTWENTNGEPGVYSPWRAYDFTTYENNRVNGWQYDVDGRLTSNVTNTGGFTYSYDAAGQLLSSAEPGRNLVQSLDGDGRKIKLTENTAVTYYLRSSVLSNIVISELDQNASKRRTYVYAGGDKPIAKQENNQVSWENRDPDEVSVARTNTNSTQTGGNELDPLGVQVDNNWGMYASASQHSYNTENGNGTFQNWMGWSTGSGMACYLDGFSAPCSVVLMALNSGAARIDTSRPSDPFWGINGLNGHFQWVADDSLDSGSVDLDKVTVTIRDGGGGQFVWIPDETSSSTLNDGRKFAHAQPQNPTDLKINHAFGDAATAISPKKGKKKDRCKDFFTQGRSLEEVTKIFKSFWQSATYDPTLGAIAGTKNSGEGLAATLRLGTAFFLDEDDDGKQGTGLSWNSTYNIYTTTLTNLTPRQNRALTILHEFAHALGLIPRDRDNPEQSTKNDAIIYEKCGYVLDLLPWRD